jgi:hypothetical protein
MADTAADRIKAAVGDRPDHAYAAVSAKDVADLGHGVTHTAATAAIVGGALVVVSERWGLPANHAKLVVHQQAGDLRELLKVAGGSS